jgi:hypothetical protein
LVILKFMNIATTVYAGFLGGLLLSYGNITGVFTSLLLMIGLLGLNIQTYNLFKRGGYTK